MERIAIPVFECRVSPVLDSCNRMILVDIDHGKEVRRSEIFLDRMQLMERIAILSRMDIQKIICAGVTETLCRHLSARGILLISGIAGEIETIISSYLCNRITDASLLMPGKKKPGGP